MSIHNYSKPSLTTDMVLFRINVKESESKRKLSDIILEVLMVRRDREPQQGSISLPGGFVNIDESIEDNVVRKVKEKTGIEGNYYTEQLITKGELDRDPRGRVISVSYIGLGNEETIEGSLKEGSDWYEVEGVLEGEYGEIAFDHKEIIEIALNRIKNKVEYTDIAFNLLSSEFTISEVQRVYELLLDKEILNFRRKIKDYLISLNKKTEGHQFRSAELFTLNKNREGKF